jgi:branched-chain amino acid transport system permease protein
MWNLLAGYADIVTVGQHAFVGVGAYGFYGFCSRQCQSPYGDPAGGDGGPPVRAARNGRRPRLRAAYLAVGTWGRGDADAARRQTHGLRRRPGVSLPVAVVKVFGSRAEERYATIYWMASPSPSLRSRRSTCCCARASASA